MATHVVALRARRGCPFKWLVKLSGITNDPACEECGDLNGNYYLDWVDICNWAVDLDVSSPCGFEQLQLSLHFDEETGLTISVNFFSNIPSIGDQCLWEKLYTTDPGCLQPEYILEFIDVVRCDCDTSSATCKVYPIGFPLTADNADSWSCYFPMSGGIDPWEICENPPFLGSLITYPAPLMFPLFETVQAVAARAANPDDALTPS